MPYLPNAVPAAATADGLPGLCSTSSVPYPCRAVPSTAEPRLPTTSGIGITLETALATACQTLASVAERAKQHGYYSGARTEIINAHADNLRAALDMLVKVAVPGDPSASGMSKPRGLKDLPDNSVTR